MTPKKMWAWIIGFNYFNLMDALLTGLGTAHLGAFELNPIVRYILGFGLIPFILFKILIGVLASVYIIKKKKYRLAKWFTFIFGAVVLWNIIMLILA